jgi:alanine racemase
MTMTHILMGRFNQYPHRMRPSWIAVDLNAIEANARAIATVVQPAELCAVVKADAYGHGDVPVAEAALRGGASWLAVALVTEGARLREADIEAPILLLAEPDAAEIPTLLAWNLTPTVYRRSFVSALAAAADRSVPVHLKVDTGMHRVGAAPEEALALARLIDQTPNLTLQAVWTHFAVSEEDRDFTDQQLRELKGFVKRLDEEGIVPEMAHAANTAAALDHPEARLDMVRVGLGIYGLRPAAGVGAGIPLTPAMRVLSRVAYTKRLPAGARPSYGRRRPLATDATVATVPIGYADGVARRLSATGGGVLINGKRYPFAGTVTMDQIVIDVGDDEVAVGDEVILLGADITAEEWADRLDTINYEIVCAFGPRLPRIYTGGPGE